MIIPMGSLNVYVDNSVRFLFEHKIHNVTDVYIKGFADSIT